MLFIPIVFLTYLYHEFGHWIVGEMLGNDMMMSLNHAGPRSEYFIDESHVLYSAMGGPAFSLLFLVILRSNYILKISLKANLYFFTISTMCILLVIGIDKLFL